MVKNYLTYSSTDYNILSIFEYDEALGYYAAAMITVSIFRLIGQSLSLFLTAKLRKKRLRAYGLWSYFHRY